MKRCPCVFCLRGMRRLCVWRDAPAIEMLPESPQRRWKVVLDWMLCGLFAGILVMATLLARQAPQHEPERIGECHQR